MRVFSIQHDRQGLTEVARVSEHIDGVAEALLSYQGVAGAVVLSTCNRVEVILDTVADVPNSCLRSVLNRGYDTAPAWDLYLGGAALGHLFRVAAGLDSMVVGEREIAGQLKRALRASQEAGQVSLPLTIAIEEALKTSRRIANQTTLEGTGRSVVGTGLDLIGAIDWPRLRALIVGTGSYAGAVVASLRQRGVTDITVHSSSGRAATFAAGHDIDHVTHLADGLAKADLVITCRGQGAFAITSADVRRPHTFLDLSLKRDVAPDVAILDGVRVIDLATIQEHVGEHIAEDARAAKSLVNAGISGAMTKLRARVVDPVVVGLRESVMDMVADEVARLPHRDLTHEDAALALRRLATRLLHVPSARAHQAAEEGRTDAYLTAMAELYGIRQGDMIDADKLEEQTCPVTNLKVCDLETVHGLLEVM